MKSIGLIPRKRLKNIPENLRVLHEYCFFLHDECARILVEYEKKDAHIVSIKFRDPSELALFEKIANEHDVVEALNRLGYLSENRRVIINSIILAMLSDCLHHIYEALCCFEKRKFVVGFNLFRKPLLDSLVYLSWILCREEEFYATFNGGDPAELTQNKLGNIRKQLFIECIDLMELSNFLHAEELHDALFKKSNTEGLYLYFQHAVHLITVQHQELKTSSQNFNFIFSNPIEEYVYENLYDNLPYILLYMSHLTTSLFNRMASMNEGSATAFNIRSLVAFQVLYHEMLPQDFSELTPLFERLSCQHCEKHIKITRYNLVRLLLTEGFRCNFCRRNNYFPLSWLF